LDQIADATASLIGTTGRVADLFTGSTVVAQAFARRGYEVAAVDTQRYAVVFADALLGIARRPGEKCDAEFVTNAVLGRATERNFKVWLPFVDREDRALRLRDHQALQALYAELPLIWRDPRNKYFNTTQGDVESSAIGCLPLLTSIYAGQYFGVRQALAIDRLRHTVEALRSTGVLSQWQFNVALTAIMNAASSAVHSAGKHFAQPLNAGSSTNYSFLDKRLASDRQICIKSQFKAACTAIQSCAPFSNAGHYSNHMAAEDFVKTSPAPFDMYYVDPPYTAQQYSRFYHILETIVTYQLPQLLHNGRLTTGLYPLNRYKSAFSSRKNAVLAFRAIIRQAKAQKTALLISYSVSARDSRGNARMISLEDLIRECKDGFGDASVDWGRMSHRYRQFNNAASSNDRRDDTEILIKCKTR
jgi:adenine-specific DNA methylase